MASETPKTAEVAADQFRKYTAAAIGHQFKDGESQKEFLAKIDKVLHSSSVSNSTPGTRCLPHQLRKGGWKVFA